MSNEKRAYTKRKRADAEVETRARIAQAAVDLHGTVGPAFTTISAVAARAGVRRATVYRHFPDEAALFAACSGRWLSQNPLPDLDPLRALPTGIVRCTAALDLIYAYYRSNARMLGNVIRDAETSPALRATLEGFGVWLGDLRSMLEEGLDASTRTGHLRRPAIAHAVSFAAWQELCLNQGLSDVEARDLMCGLVRAVSE